MDSKTLSTESQREETDRNRNRNRYRHVVLVASFLSLFFNASLDLSSGVFHVALLKTYQSDVNVTVWLGSLFFCMFGLTGPIASFIINVSDCRTCVFLSGILGLVGFSANFFIYDIRWLFLTYALLAGTGTALSHTGSLVVLGYYFRDNMSLACGIAVCGMAAGLFIHPRLCQFLIDTFGLHGAFLVIGGLAFHSSVCGLLMTPTKFEIQRRGKVLSGRPRRIALLIALCGDCIGFVRILRNRSFVFFLLSGMTFGMGLSSLYIFLPDFLNKKGISNQDASFSVSLSGIGGVISRVLTGFAAQDPQIGSGLLYAPINGLMGVLCLLTPVFTFSELTVYIYGFLMGLYTGGTWALFSPITFDILGIEWMATGYGALMFSCGFGCLIGAPMAGYAYEVSRAYYGVYVFAAAMFFSCTLCGYLSTMCRMSSDVSCRSKGQDVTDVEITEENRAMFVPDDKT